jgi:hypothetical protein
MRDEDDKTPQKKARATERWIYFGVRHSIFVRLQLAANGQAMIAHGWNLEIRSLVFILLPAILVLSIGRGSGSGIADRQHHSRTPPAGRPILSAAGSPSSYTVPGR